MYTDKEYMNFKEKFLHKQVKLIMNETKVVLQATDIFKFKGNDYMVAHDNKTHKTYLFKDDNNELKLLKGEIYHEVVSYYNNVLAEADADDVRRQKEEDLK